MLKYWWLAGGFFIAHGVASWVAFTKSSLIKPNAYTHLWRQAAEVLAMPLVYLQPASDTDWFLLLMIGNSIVWALTLTGLMWLIGFLISKGG